MSETFADLVSLAIERAGGLRKLAKVISSHGEVVSATQLGYLRDGMSKMDMRVYRAAIEEWPDLRDRFNEAMGLSVATVRHAPIALVVPRRIDHYRFVLRITHSQFSNSSGAVGRLVVTPKLSGYCRALCCPRRG